MAKSNAGIRAEYERVRGNLESQVESLQGRGYYFDKDPIPKEVKNPSEASIRNIERAKGKLYDESYGYINGERVSGKVYRGYLRREAGRKGAITRRKRREAVDIGEAVFNYINGIIGELNTQGKTNSADEISKAFNSEIEASRQMDSANGVSAYKKYLGEFQAEITDFGEALLTYNAKTPMHRGALTKLITILQGGRSYTAEELMRLSEELDEDEMYEDFEDIEDEDLDIFDDEDYELPLY